MKHLKFFTTFEAAYMTRDGKLVKISDEEFDNLKSSGQAKPVSLKDFFKGPIKTPYNGLVIKTNNGTWGVIIDVFERNGDYLFDLFLPDTSIEKNLSWSRDFKNAFGDRLHGWSAFGEDGEPNKRHIEIINILNKAEDFLGISLGTAKPENLN